MRIIARKTLKQFWAIHNDCEEPLKSWYYEVKKAYWNNPNELKKDYPNASIIENNRVVFNIKGNKYRIIVRVNYDYKIMWIRFIGTHGEYDKINAKQI